MFWLPITLSVFLIVWQLFLQQRVAITFDVFILFNTLDDQLWHDAPQPVKAVINRCSKDLLRLHRLALASCVGLMLLIFAIIASYRGDPYQSSIVIVICAIDCYGYFFLFRRLYEKLYVHSRYPKLKTAINYLLTFKDDDTQSSPK